MSNTLVLKSHFISKSPEARLYQLPIPVIGLTGGIATGKSTVAKLLAESGFAVINADQLVKNIYATQEANDFIKNHFPECLNQDQSINFKSLRKLVFEKSEIKTQVENFIYQRMPLQFKMAFNEFNSPQVIIYDVPLLFEKKLDQLVDLSVCVYLPQETQLERLMKRDQIDRKLAESILKEQIPIEEKKRLSKIVIENQGSIDDLKIAVNQFIKNCF